MNQFFGRPYVDGARGPEAFDCWGLALAVRAELGLPELPADPLAVRGNGPAIAGQFRQVTGQLESTERPEPGSLAAVFKGPLFVHVGVVVAADGRLWALETNPGTGVVMRTLADFQAAYYKVIYYRDRDLPESP